MWPELIYIAGAQPLPLIPWNPDAPAFHVRELKGTDDAESIRKQVTLPWVYSLCSHEWGWSGVNAWDHPDEPAEELEAWDESRRQLAEYVAGVVAEFGAIELYASNPGWEKRPVQHVSCVRVAQVPELFRWLQSEHYALVDTNLAESELADEQVGLAVAIDVGDAWSREAGAFDANELVAGFQAHGLLEFRAGCNADPSRRPGQQYCAHC